MLCGIFDYCRKNTTIQSSSSWTLQQACGKAGCEYNAIKWFRTQNTRKITSQTGHIFPLQLNGPININQIILFRINVNEKKQKYVFKWNVPQHTSQTGLGDVSPSQTSRRLRKTRELVVTPALSTGAITEHLPMVKPELRTAKYSQSVGWNFPRTGTLLRMIHLISTTCRNSDH